jgi:hypothetical protein
MKLAVKNIRLMTLEEAKNLPSVALAIGKPWWLDPKGSQDKDASAFVTSNGGLYDCSSRCNANMSLGIRPLLEFESPDLDMGAMFTIAGHRWQVVFPDKALYTGFIGQSTYKPTKLTVECVKFLHDWAVKNSFTDEKEVPRGEDR